MVEHMYHCKDDSMSMKDVYEDLVQHLSKDVKFIDWNIGTTAVKYTLKKYDCGLGEQQPIKGQSEEDGIFIDTLMHVFLSYEYEYEELNWATKQIGTWITKNFNQIITSCPNVDVTEFQEKVNKFFTKDGDQVSILDIGHLFSIMDVEALVAKSYQGRELDFTANDE